MVRRTKTAPVLSSKDTATIYSSEELLKIILRSEARSAGMKRYFTGLKCINGHVSERWVSNKVCVTCFYNRLKLKNNAGGTNHNKELNRSKKRRKIGGIQRANYLAGIKKWQKTSMSPGAVKRRITHFLRSRLKRALKNNHKVGSAVRDLGCSIAEFRDYIAKQFTQGMSWDNHGEWHLDHKKPLASFNLIDREQFLQAVHFSNYQPLWAADNLKKGASI